MTCNCNRTGDVEYTITLNQQGPQGRQGNVGQDGFSPIVDVYSNTEANYQLKIISAEGEIITPNLKGQDGTSPTIPNDVVRRSELEDYTTIEQFDELADDVIDINSQLAGLSFKKYTEEEYASITNPDANTLYMVTNPDGNTFKLYLGSIELEGGGGGTVLSGDNASQKTYIENVDASVSATKVV